MKKINKDEFVKLANEKHNNKFDYFYVNLRCNSFSKKEDSKHVLKVFLH